MGVPPKNPTRESNNTSLGNQPTGDLEFRFNVHPGDNTKDGLIDGADLSRVLGSWLATVPTAEPLIDLNGNAIIDSGDLSALLGKWLSKLPDGEPSAPGSQLMAMSIPANNISLASLSRFGPGLLTTANRHSHSVVFSIPDKDTIEPLPNATARSVVVDVENSLAI